MYEKQKGLILEAIKNKDAKRIDEILDDMYPIDIAIMLEDFEEFDILNLFLYIDNEKIASIIEQCTEELQAEIINMLDKEQIVNLFKYMSNDDIADILGEMSISLRKELLKEMKQDAKQLQELLGYDEDSAGGIMTTEYVALSDRLNLKQSLEKIKSISPKTEIIDTIFVINKQRELVGTAYLRNILCNDENELLKDIMNDNVISVYPEQDQEEVSLLVSKYDLTVIPVINKKNHILGIITIDDIIDVIVEEQTEDILHLGGVNKEERLDNSIASSVQKRLPWLFINLCTAFLASFTVGLFEDTIAQVVALAAAMPIVAGMGGNAGTQTLSLVIRSITLGEISLSKSWKLVFREIALGIINGATTGIVTGIIMYMVYGNIYLGVIIFVAMIINLIIAGFFGFLIPLVLKALNIDPALASAIFLTTATDVFGFFVFLGLAQIFLPLLL